MSKNIIVDLKQGTNIGNASVVATTLCIPLFFKKILWKVYYANFDTERIKKDYQIEELNAVHLFKRFWLIDYKK